MISVEDNMECFDCGRTYMWGILSIGGVEYGRYVACNRWEASSTHQVIIPAVVAVQVCRSCSLLHPPPRPRCLQVSLCSP